MLRQKRSKEEEGKGEKRGDRHHHCITTRAIFGAPQPSAREKSEGEKKEREGEKERKEREKEKSKEKKNQWRTHCAPEREYRRKGSPPGREREKARRKEKEGRKPPTAAPPSTDLGLG
ncbi:hypothetical protein U1Q18_003900, partial [Sarracenia purpurea var. burkii]